MSIAASFPTTRPYPATHDINPCAVLARVFSSWRYNGGKRDVRLDLLRGFAALVMIADHVGGRSWLLPVTGGNQFIVSAAEVFVLISGVLVGVVYGKLMLRNGALAGLKKAIMRAAKLYLLTIVLTFAFAAAGSALDLWWQPVLASGALRDYVFDVVTFQQTIFLVDIPLVYTLLLLLAAPALWLLRRGQTFIVLAASWSAWGVWQVAPGSLGWQIADNTVFHLASWQVIFVTAMAIGYHRDAIEARIARLTRGTMVIALLIAGAAMLALYVAQLTQLEDLRSNPWLYEFAFDKPNVPAGRLLALALVGGFAYAVLTLAWLPVRRVTGWLLLPLGENALTAYSLHLAVVAVTTKVSLVYFPSGLSPLTSTALQVAAVLAVWFIVCIEPGLRRHASGMVVATIRPLFRRPIGVAPTPSSVPA